MHCMVVVLVFSLPCTLGQYENAQDALSKIESGVSAGKAIIEFLQSKEFSKTLTKLGNQIKPFLGAIGPVISIVTGLLPTVSPELEFMKKEFQKMDAKFDRVFQQFADLKNAIKKASLRAQYGECELKISGLSYELSRLIKTKDTKESEAQKLFFINKYNRNFDNCAHTLWSGVTGEHFVLSDNIAETIVSYTDGDRKQVQHALKGVTQLILLGVKVHLAYLKANGDVYAAKYKSDEKLWEDKIKTLLNKIKSVDRDVVRKFNEQSGKDARKLAAEHSSKSHSKVAKIMYDHFVKKFYWRDWFVAVYDDIWDFKNHAVMLCASHGSHEFRASGFNVVLANVDKQASTMDRMSAKTTLDSLVTYNKKVFGIKTSKRAKEVYDTLREKVKGQRCSTFMGLGVIQDDAEPAFSATPSRLVYVKKKYFYIYLYG